MIIAGIQKLSMVDYPGKMACTIFFTGCNFRCPYCHNSSLVVPEPDQPEISEEEVFRFLNKRQGLLDGVCITGGEPLLWGQDLVPFIRKIKELGYSVKLDTNGSFPELLRELCESGLVDYVAMDIKNSWNGYEAATGRKMQTEQSLIAKVQESASYLMGGVVDYEFRTTLVKGIHSIQDVEELSKMMQNAKVWYLQNFKDSGSVLNSNFQKMSSFSENETILFEKTAKRYNINVFVRNV